MNLTDEDVNAICAVFPEDGKTLKEGHSPKELAARLILLSRSCRERLVAATDSKKVVADAYRASWVDAIRIAKSSQDKMTWGKIFDTWNESFSRKDQTAALVQLIALGEELDSRFLSEQMWSYATGNADCGRLVEAVSYATYRTEDRKYLAQLDELQKACQDAHGKQMIQRAINWINYGHVDQNSPGPAEAPPAKVSISAVLDIMGEK
jgi:hypothetical protein